MSAVGFQSPSYKLVESGYGPGQVVIVGEDDGLDSANTIARQYENATRVTRGGESRSASPAAFTMAAYTKTPLPAVPGYEAARYADGSYDQYSAQTFNTPQTDKFAQLNQQSFASNNSVAQYMPTGPTVLSCQPMSGVFGTKIFLKVSSQYDLFALASPMPYFAVCFGAEKVPVHMVRDAQDTSSFVYTCSADAPQLMVTGSSGTNVPLSVVVEGPSGEEISRTGAGSFQYLEGSGDDITRTDKLPKQQDATAPGPPVDQANASPKTIENHMAQETATNSYDYPTQPGQYPGAFPQNNNDMITAYRSSSFTDPHYHTRRPAPSWAGFGATLGSSRGSLDHSALGSGRSSLTPLPMPSSGGSGNTPQLIRTSTIASAAGASGSYHPISLYSSKAVLKISGKLDTMAENWTQEEWDNRRRIVMFRKSQSGSTLTANFRAVPVNDRPAQSICVSCIWWAEKGECYVTSVDTIHLLEQLVASPNRFSVEEKNRIRRNLEGFHPLTVSKAKADSEEFFKIIMGFPNPKPRNIEKDVKVFPWKILEPALKKIIGKYSASPNSSLAPSNMVTPAYAPLPTPPGLSGMAAQQSLPGQHTDHSHGQYSMHSSHHEQIPAPRSLSGSHATWSPYSAAPAYSTPTTRVMSPNSMRNTSPQQHHHAPAPMRINTNPLPAVTTYDTRTVSTGGYSTPGLHTPISQHPPSATPPRWDTGPSASYSDGGYAGMAAHHQPGPPVYATGGYGEGATRA